ncbi:MAG: hypothetical protein ACR2KG_03260 [Nocardioidaceae bacterium]
MATDLEIRDALMDVILNKLASEKLGPSQIRELAEAYSILTTDRSTGSRAIPAG